MVDARANQDPGDIEKEGFFTGHYAVNPYSGEQVPIWVGNFVLMGYGTGAIMAVPAHDERDFEFCRKYGIAVRPVIRPVDGELAVEPGMHERLSPNTASWRIPARGPASPAKKRAGKWPRTPKSTASARPPSPSASRIGASRASAIGARPSR